MVQAMVDGKGPFKMLLDTGVDPSVIDLGTARAIGNEAWGLRIGNSFLKDFVVTIDYQSHVITLKKP